MRFPGTMSDTAAQSMNWLLAEKRPNDNCCTWTVSPVQIREQLFSPGYSHHLPFQRVHHTRTMVALQRYKFTSFSSFQIPELCKCHRFRNLEIWGFLPVCICIYTHTLLREWGTAAGSDKRWSKESVRNRITDPPWLVQLYCQTFSVLGCKSWKIWDREEGTNLGWVLRKPRPKLALPCNRIKMCWTGQTDVCKGGRSRLSLTTVLSKPFSLNVETWNLKCSAEGFFYLIYSKKGLDFMRMSNFRAQNQQATQHEILMWRDSLQNK